MADGHLQEEGWRVRRDGSHYWASMLLTTLREPDGRLTGFGTVVRDLTERRRAEVLLRESEERFRLLVNSVADYAIFLLDVDGRISSWNLGAERLKGYRADEVIGRHFSLFYPTDDLREHVPERLLATALEAGRVESEGWRVRKDGSPFWAGVVITALRSPDGTPRGFAKVTKDLTDRKRSEDALRGVLERERNAAARLRELDAMRTQVLELVVHDLRAPLAAIQNLAYTLDAGWQSIPDEERHQRTARILARTTIMNDLVDDLFDVVQIDAGELRIEQLSFDVGSVVEAAIADSLDDGRRPAVAVSGPGDVRVLGDPRRTREILTNLLTNAAKFSPADAPIEVTLDDGEGAVRVAVTDHGPGIPAADQEALFERFSRLSGQHRAPGSGLGLFISKALAEAQGGRLTVRSTEGRGSTFTVELPKAP